MEATIAAILVHFHHMTLQEATGVIARHRDDNGAPIPALDRFDCYWWLEELDVARAREAQRERLARARAKSHGAAPPRAARELTTAGTSSSSAAGAAPAPASAAAGALPASAAGGGSPSLAPFPPAPPSPGPTQPATVDEASSMLTLVVHPR